MQDSSIFSREFSIILLLLWLVISLELHRNTWSTGFQRICKYFQLGFVLKSKESIMWNKNWAVLDCLLNFWGLCYGLYLGKAKMNWFEQNCWLTHESPKLGLSEEILWLNVRSIEKNDEEFIWFSKRELEKTLGNNTSKSLQCAEVTFGISTVKKITKFWIKNFWHSSNELNILQIQLIASKLVQRKDDQN